MTPLEERFWSKVDKNGPIPPHRPDLGPCHLWIASLDHKGYGRFWLDGRTRGAHQVSWEWKHGPIPKGLEPDHLCKTHACINDLHLEPVTRAENVRRGLGPAASGARMRAKTHCPHGHPYAGDNLLMAPNGNRHCRTCNLEAVRRYKAKRRAA